MSYLLVQFSQISAIAIKNLKIRLRSYQTYLYSFGFPLLFTIIFYFMFGNQKISSSGISIFDMAIAGMLLYAASFGTINAATSLTMEKERLTLIRLDTTPVSRKSIFLGTLLSESVFLLVQLLLMFLVTYGLLGGQWYENQISLLLLGFLIIFIFGLSTLGLGIIISAYASSANNAVGIAMMYVMPILFLSGAMIPFENPIAYFCPPFWALQVYDQVIIMGDDFFTTPMRVNSTNIFLAESSSLPLWGAMLVILMILILTILVGIKLFQRKTSH